MSSLRSSITSEIEEEEDASTLGSDDESTPIAEEKEVAELCVSSKSSFRVTVNFTPHASEKEEERLRLRKQNFYLLFEVRSPREYGEISLFCQASVCGSFIEATQLIEFHSCKRGRVHEKDLVLTNKVSVVLSVVLSVVVGVVMSCCCE